MTVNETDGRGRKAKNIKRVRAVFVDLDGSPLEPVLAWERKPHDVVESSPGTFHVYWIVTGAALEDFAPAQKALAQKFGGDNVHELPRVILLDLSSPTASMRHS